MGTEARLAITEHSRAFCPQPIPRSYDVFDLIADVMHSARRIAREKGPHRRGRAERFQQLDLRVRQFDKDDGDAMHRERAWLGDARAQNLSVCGARRRDVGHNDRDMVELADHCRKLPLTQTLSPQAAQIRTT